LASASASLLWSRPRPRSHKHCPREYNLGLGLGVGLGLAFGLGHVQSVCGPSTAVYRGCKHSRVHGTRPCARSVNKGRVQRPCLWPVYTAEHDPNTAFVYTAMLWVMYGRVHGRQRPCTRAINTAMFGLSMDHVHGPCTAVYTVRTRPWKAVYTGRKHGHVQGTRTAVLYTDGRVHGRPSTRPSTLYVLRLVHTTVFRS